MRSLNIADLYEAVADAIPNRVAVICHGDRRTYADLDRRANKLAHYLESVGIEPGQHIAIHMRNRMEYVEALIACLKIRAVPINVNFRYTDSELDYLYNDSDSVCVIVEDTFYASARSALTQCARVRHTVVVDTQELGPNSHGSATNFEFEDRSVSGYEDALALQPDTRGFGPRSEKDHFVIYTGGTTGMPKGVLWQHEDFYYAALTGANTRGAPHHRLKDVVAAAVANSDAQIYLLTAPLMHGAAIYSLLTALLMGEPRVLTHSFDAMEVLRLIDAEKITGLTVVGDAIARPIADALLAQGKNYDLSSLQLIVSGGALFSQHLKDEIRALLPGIQIKDAFGASETGNDGIVEYADDGARLLRSNPNMVLLDDQFRAIDVKAGVTGFIARKGHVPLAYYNDEQKTATTFPTIDGIRYAVLGDMGRLQEDGTIVLLGRGSTCINSGGEKIYPEEVEQAIKSHPAVFDALVAGTPDRRFGERVGAVVQLRSGFESVETASIVEYCREHLAGYKIPRSLVVVPAVQRSPSGKADYRWARTVIADEDH